MSELHVFAHFGEAQSFIAGMGAKRQACPGNVDFFANCNRYIMITGEGEHAAAVSLTTVLTAFTDIEKIWNWGVAGSLDQKLTPGDIYPVRTVYGQKFAESFQFHSFTLSSTPESRDNISAITRVLTPDLAEHLGRVAPLVDMELWSLCSVAKRFSVPIESHKIVSDLAGQPVCDLVRENAAQWSDELWNYYRSRLSTERQESFKYDELFKFLYLTKSQKQRLEKLIRLFELRRKDVDLKDLHIFQENKKIKPKARTNLAIEWFENELLPVRKKILGDIDLELEPLRKAGIALTYDRSLEDPNLCMGISAQSVAEFQEKLTQLSHFDFSKFADHLSGERLEI